MNENQYEILDQAITIEFRRHQRLLALLNDLRRQSVVEQPPVDGDGDPMDYPEIENIPFPMDDNR